MVKHHIDEPTCPQPKRLKAEDQPSTRDTSENVQYEISEWVTNDKEKLRAAMHQPMTRVALRWRDHDSGRIKVKEITFVWKLEAKPREGGVSMRPTLPFVGRDAEGIPPFPDHMRFDMVGLADLFWDHPVPLWLQGGLRKLGHRYLLDFLARRCERERGEGSSMVLASTKRFSSNSARNIATAISRDGTDLTRDVSATTLDSYDHDRGSGFPAQTTTEIELADDASHSVWIVGMTLSFGNGWDVEYGNQECTMS